MIVVPPPKRPRATDEGIVIGEFWHVRWEDIETVELKRSLGFLYLVLKTKNDSFKAPLYLWNGKEFDQELRRFCPKGHPLWNLLSNFEMIDPASMASSWKIVALVLIAALGILIRLWLLP